MSRIILDASALIAAIYHEKGADIVRNYLPHAAMSAVNLTEVASYLAERGMAAAEIRALLGDLAIDIVTYNEAQAFLAAELRATTKAQGLSLGDRACLALAMMQHLPVLTADRAWAKIDVSIPIELIR